MIDGLAGSVARAIGRVGEKLFDKAKSRRAVKRVRRETRVLVPTEVAEGLLTELDEAETSQLNDYLASPDFEEVALQFVLGYLLDDVPWEELTANIREELRHGLRNFVGLRTELLVTAADVVFGALATGCNDSLVAQEKPLRPGPVAAAAHLTAAAAANS